MWFYSEDHHYLQGIHGIGISTYTFNLVDFYSKCSYLNLNIPDMDSLV